MIGNNSSAIAIDASGRISGWMGPNSAMGHAFLWNAGQVLDLGPIPGGISSAPNGMSNSGIIVGLGKLSLQQQGFSAFRWRDGVMELLQPLAGDDQNDEVVAYGVNDEGIAVGSSHSKGCVWVGTVPVALSTLVSSNISVGNAMAINNAGQIAARGTVDNEPALLVLTPVFAQTDLNGDCATGPADLAILLSQWGQASSSSSDFDHDGAVGPADLAQLLAHWSD